MSTEWCKEIHLLSSPLQIRSTCESDDGRFMIGKAHKDIKSAASDPVSKRVPILILFSFRTYLYRDRNRTQESIW